MARTTSDEWGRYYQRAEERREIQGGDPVKRYLKRCMFRDRCLMTGTCLLLVGLIASFYLVLIH